VIVTPAPGDSRGTIREIVSLLAVDGMAMMGLPFLALAAPRVKSTWPPKPE
jgi:hypothetical protein